MSGTANIGHPTTAQARIARSLDLIGDHYTVVVVGSGYGAGVAASRMARAGQDVCVLERGREMLPGEYPDKLADARGAMQANTSRGIIGEPDAMFDLHVNEDMWALVGCGLGGTSLINANVALEMDRRLLELEHWPQAFRSNPHLLDPYYKRATRMLSSTPYPDHYPELGKLKALEEAADKLGQEYYRPPINVTFEDKTNAFGVPQPACTNCGDCCSGCNVGAKNTTLMNYLPDAHNHGAQIFTQARVTHLERDGDKWRVYFEPNGSGAPGEPGSVTADHVFLGAGSLGSSEILLRSKAKGLPLSDRLGSRFSGNGDALGFSYDSYWKTTTQHVTTGGKTADKVVGEPIYSIGIGANDVPKEKYPGPCIAGVIDIRGVDNVEQGLVIEEGVPPGIVSTLLPPAFFFAEAYAGSFTRFGFDQIEPRLLDAKAMGEGFQKDPGNIGNWAYEGPMSRMQTYLIMSVDDAGGQLTLVGDRLTIDWPGAGALETMERDSRWMELAADAISGQYFPDPLWTQPLGKNLITVHPVGGCAMADDAADGVVDDACRVFSGTTGTDVHPGLYVCDGAAMPGAVGVNPLLTITAVAERAVELVAAREGWTIDEAMREDGTLPPAPQHGAGEAVDLPDSKKHYIPTFADKIEQWVGSHLVNPLARDIARIAHLFEEGLIDAAKDAVKSLVKHHPDLMSPQFQFTERMHGFVSTEGIGNDAPAIERISDNFTNAEAWGKADGQPCSFELTVHTDDLNDMVTRPGHAATLTGTVTCPSITADPMAVESGTFHLLTVDEDKSEGWLMTYDMVLAGPDGPLKFHGFKVLEQRQGSDPWTDLTKLFITIHDGADGSGDLRAQGILRLNAEDLMWQASTMRLDLQKGLVGWLIGKVPKARVAIAEYFAATFAAFFGMTTFQAYGGMLATLKDFPQSEAKAKGLDEPKTSPSLKQYEPRSHIVPTADGVTIGLTNYHGGTKGPVVLAPGFSVRAWSFAAATVPDNLVEQLCAAGYDVWLFDYRASADSGNSRTHPPAFTIDDIASKDWPAAVDFIRRYTGAKDLQAMAHCVGSMSLLMGLARGWVPGFRQVLSSQLTLHPVTDWLNYLKSDLGMSQLMGRISQLDGVFDFTPNAEDDTSNEIDAVAFQLPVPEGQACKNPTCRRVFGVYGPSYDHGQLGHDTHVALASMFSRISLAPFAQLQDIMRDGRVVDAEGEDTYLTQDNARRMILPITFLAGSTNQIFYPESGQRTMSWLKRHNPDHAGLYKQILFPGYAHMDLFIGRNAGRDVAPQIVAELDRYN